MREHGTPLQETYKPGTRMRSSFVIFIVRLLVATSVLLMASAFLVTPLTV